MAAVILTSNQERVMLQVVAVLIFISILFIFIASSAVGRVALYALTAISAISIAWNIKNTGKNYIGFLVTLTTTIAISYLVFVQFSSGNDCNGFYSPQYDPDRKELEQYGIPRQSGQYIDSSNYSNICQYPGFQSACRAYEKCLQEPPSHRPLIVFLNMLLTLLGVATLKLIPYRIFENKPNIENNNQTTSEHKKNPFSSVTQDAPTNTTETINNANFSGQRSQNSQNPSNTPTKLTFMSERTNALSKRYILGDSYANAFDGENSNEWTRTLVNEDIDALNNGLQEYSKLISSRVIGARNTDFYIDLAHGYAHGKYHGPYKCFYTEKRDALEVADFQIDKVCAMTLLSEASDILILEYKNKRRTKVNLANFESQWKRILEGYFNEIDGVFAADIFKKEFPTFPRKNITDMHNEARRLLKDRFEKNIDVLDHWFEKLALH